MVKFLIFFILIFSLLDCTNSNNNDSNLTKATITGRDFRKCMCCGGWIIKIDTLDCLFDNLPASATFNLDSEKYPLPVLIAYTKKTEYCDNFITITTIKKQ